MTVIVKHNKTNSITDWTQAQLDEQIALGNFPPGTTLANIVLPSDWNNDHTLTGLGTMAEQDATAVAITGGTINNATIGATTATTGRFTSVTTPSVTATTLDLALNSVGTGTINLSSGNGIAFRALDNGATGNSWAAYGSTVSPVLEASGSSTNVNGIVRTKGTGILAFRTNTIDEQLRVSHTTSAVNYVQVTGGATGTYPAILGTGSDGTVGLQLAGKGGTIDFRNNGIGTATQFSVAFTASSVNYLNATGSGVSGNAPRLFALGTDTNISMAFQPKGTGAIDLVAGSSGVNISNGGTVTAITRTGNGTGYTSFPSVAITAPTTAGGVQAVASLTNMQSIGASISAGGTGYAVGNVITIVGGTPVTVAATFTVSAVSSGVVTAVTALNFAPYTVLPTAPVSTTGGAGTGLTLTNLTWAIGSSFTITNAGSGYIEQPTITFSGGGGSGAAAYATVGSGTTVKSIGSTMLLQTPGGTAFGVTDIANAVNYIRNQGSATGFQVFSTVQGTDTNTSYALTSKGNGAVSLYTNLGSQLQFSAAHTASAVNYVQVTGGATTVRPLISVQGSDTNIGMTYGAKGTGIHAFTNGNGTQLVLQAGSTSSVNRIEITPTVTGSAPILSAGGTDTNIDLALTPKGTGLVRFGTLTATADVAISGYIQIKDSGGTIRKLAVIT